MTVLLSEGNYVPNYRRVLQRTKYWLPRQTNGSWLNIQRFQRFRSHLRHNDVRLIYYKAPDPGL